MRHEQRWQTQVRERDARQDETWEAYAAAEFPNSPTQRARFVRNQQAFREYRGAAAASQRVEAGLRIALMRRGHLPDAETPVRGLSPQVRQILSRYVPGTDMAAGRRAYEAMEAAMGTGPEEAEEAARARAVVQAQAEAQDAWIAERMRE